MKEDSIELSPQYGLNPSLIKCFICGKDTGVAILGKLKDDAEAPKELYNDLCDECKKIIDDGGSFILEVKNGTSHDNPKRTGRLIGVSKQYVERMKEFFKLDIINYMEESAFDRLNGSKFKEENNGEKSEEKRNRQCKN